MLKKKYKYLYGSYFNAFDALRLKIAQLLSIPNISTPTFQSHIKLNSARLTSAAQRKTFSSTWWSFSWKLIYSSLYPVIFLSLKTLLLMIHKKFFRKQKHGKIHVVRDYMEDPLFAHVEVKTGKASSRL